MINENILSLIPQAHPFVMIDNLLFADEVISRTNFIIKKQNIFFENDVFVEAGLLENIAQTAAAGAGFRARQQNKKIEAGYIAAIKSFEVFSLPGIDSQLLTEVVIKENIFNIIIVEGKIFCNDALVAQCEMKIFTNAND